MFGNKPGHRLIQLDETDSTNSYAARLLHDQVPEQGTAILTGFQKAGKGQRGASWESEAGKNLLISYILYPSFLKITEQFLLNQVIALSLIETLQKLTSAKIAIKWPNDILANESKIAGILIENAVRNEKIIHSVVGIGLNLNQDRFHAYNIPAISLSMLEKRKFDTRYVLNLVNDSIDKWYNLLHLGNSTRIRSEYMKWLFLLQTPAKFESEGVDFDGMITGVKDDGRLEISSPGGKIRTFGNKEVKFLI